MPKLFLNRDLIFKKREDCYYVYNNRTGSFFYGDEELWRFLKSFRSGRELDTLKREPSFPKWNKLLPKLIGTKYLLFEARSEIKQYLNFFPTRTFYTVYYEHEGGTDVAVHRIGLHGVIDFEIFTFKGTTETLWNLCNGNNTLQQLISFFVENTGDDYGAVKYTIFEKMSEWTSLDTQILRLLPQPLLSYETIPLHLLSPAPFIPSLKVSPSKQVKDTRRYHISGIDEGYDQFERVESTLSHIYRVPHPILGGKSYGEAFLSRLSELKPMEEGCRVLEIGGGHGDISKEILVALKEKKPDISSTLTYIIYDLSPELIKSQRRLHNEAGVHVEHIHGDAESLALADASVDIILSNEVIADFPTPELSLRDLKRLLNKYGIPINQQFLDSLKDAPERFRLNLGAFRLLKEIQRVLKPGGIAIVTEYGYRDRLPFRAKHLDHAEYSIHFGQMVSIAEELGVKVRLTDAFKFLDFQLGVELITHPSFQAAFRILEHHGIHLPNIVYTKELLREQIGEKADSMKNIKFAKATKDPIEMVKVLICEKPAA
ncbi:MAG: class I SAM-dependent methyltransferase [Candidatus Hydrothermarchaeales archaeon]